MIPPPPVPPAGSTLPLRSWFALPLLAAAGFNLMAVLLPAELAETAGPILFLGSLFLFGLPHGASDAILAPALWPRKFRWSLFLSLYLLIVGLVLILGFLSAPLVLLAFLLLTAWHWGSAEVMPWMREETPGIWTWSLARGGWVITAPFAFHPESTHALLSTWQMEIPMTLPPLFWISVCLLCYLIDFAGSIYAATAHRRWYQAELLALLPVAMVLPPLWWVGLYLMFFHAWRHGLRLVTFLGQGNRDNSVTKVGQRAFVLIHRMAPWTFAAALLMVVPVTFLRQGSLSPDPLLWAGDYLLLLAALTLPHAALVRCLDYREKDTPSGSGQTAR